MSRINHAIRQLLELELYTLDQSIKQFQTLTVGLKRDELATVNFSGFIMPRNK